MLKSLLSILLGAYPEVELFSHNGSSVVKNTSAKQEMQVRYLGREDPLEKEMATHCSILAWEIPWTEGPGRLQSIASQTVRT